MNVSVDSLFIPLKGVTRLREYELQILVKGDVWAFECGLSPVPAADFLSIALSHTPNGEYFQPFGTSAGVSA